MSANLLKEYKEIRGILVNLIGLIEQWDDMEKERKGTTPHLLDVRAQALDWRNDFVNKCCEVFRKQMLHEKAIHELQKGWLRRNDN